MLKTNNHSTIGLHEMFDTLLTDCIINSLTPRKDHLVTFAKQRFQEGKDYQLVTQKSSFGRPKHEYWFTSSAMNLLVKSFNLRSVRLIQDRRDQMVSPILMPLETATIGFLYDVLKDVTSACPQYMCGPYKIDLYLPDYCICIECDERNHKDRPAAGESIRQAYIQHALGAKFIRFDPSISTFELPQLVGKVLKLMIDRTIEQHDLKENLPEVSTNR